MDRGAWGLQSRGLLSFGHDWRLGWHVGNVSIFLSLCICLLWTFHISGITICSFFFLVLLSIIVSGFIHLVAWITTSFLFTGEIILHCLGIPHFFFYCITVALHWCISFCSSAKWISHFYTYITCFVFSSHLGHHRAPSRVPWAIQQVLISYLFYT